MDKEKFTRAYDLFRRGYDLQAEGNMSGAIEFYHDSIREYPTPEAHTYLGWAYSVKGELEHAISECEKAVELDPGYGNPYNDIGAYLMKLERFDEAVEWLLKAVTAPRNEAKYFALYNLGRLYERKGEWGHALRYYTASLHAKEEFEPSKKAMMRLTAALN